VLWLTGLASCDSTGEGAVSIGLDAPVALAPASGQVVVVQIPFTVAWTDVEGAQSYELEVRSMGDGSTHAFSAPQAAAVVALRVPGDVEWRVRGLDAFGRTGYWSLPRRLTVQATTP
jgi:hypothetical protein